LTGLDDNTLKLNLNDLLDFSSKTNILKIGDSGDKVETTGFNKLEASDVVIILLFLLPLSYLA
jgi:hypothetical protein